MTSSPARHRPTEAPAAPRSAEYEAGRAAERAALVAQLRFLATARGEYFHGPQPKHSGDLDAMNASDLIVWCESETANKLADLVAGENDAKGWLPSWRWSEWDQLRDPDLDPAVPAPPEAPEALAAPEAVGPRRQAAREALMGAADYLLPGDTVGPEFLVYLAVTKYGRGEFDHGVAEDLIYRRGDTFVSLEAEDAGAPVPAGDGS